MIYNKNNNKQGGIKMQNINEEREHSLTYPLLYRKITAKRYKTKAELQHMLHVLYSALRIYDFEYEELTTILENQ